MSELSNSLEYLNETKQQIKQALIDKGQEISEEDSFRSYVDKINNIETGIDTSDATASANDIIYDKTAYVDGQKITGNIEILEAPFEHDWQASTITYNDDKKGQYITLKTPSPENIYIKTGAEINAEISAQNTAAAISLTADKIKSSETILGIQGSVVELNGDTEIVTPTTFQQIITPTSPKNGLTQVTVNAVTSAIDVNIVAR